MDPKLTIKPKEYKLKCSQEVMDTLLPYFELSSSSYSSMTKDQKHKDQTEVDEETLVTLEMRDANSGELLGKGHMLFDKSLESKPEVFEEKVVLKDFLGNEIGEVLVEVKHEKHDLSKKNIEHEFRKMRKEMNKMIRDTNKMFENFANKHFGKDWGYGLMDDYQPHMLPDMDPAFLLGLMDEPTCDNCKCHEKKKKHGHHHRRGKHHVELAHEPHNKDNKENKDQGNKASGNQAGGNDNVEIKSEKA